MFDFIDPNKDKDLSNKRAIEIHNNKIYIEKKDPYGFWSVNFEKGATPKSLKGQYTSPNLAERDIQMYLRTKDIQPTTA